MGQARRPLYRKMPIASQHRLDVLAHGTRKQQSRGGMVTPYQIKRLQQVGGPFAQRRSACADYGQWAFFRARTCQRLEERQVNWIDARQHLLRPETTRQKGSSNV